MDMRGGGARFSVENFLSHSAELHKISSIEKIYGYEGAGGREEQDFLWKIFLSHSAEKFRRGTLLCCVSENFW